MMSMILSVSSIQKTGISLFDIIFVDVQLVDKLEDKLKLIELADYNGV